MALVPVLSSTHVLLPELSNGGNSKRTRYVLLLLCISFLCTRLYNILNLSRELSNLNLVCESGQIEEALQITEQRFIVLSTNNSYCLLRQLTKNRDLQSGRKLQRLLIHSEISSLGTFVDHLIRLFAFCGCLLESNQAFSHVAQLSGHTWTAAISANVNLRQFKTALELHWNMLLHGLMDNEFIILSILKACAVTLALEHGKLAHQQAIESGMVSDVYIGSTLVSMYSKCGCLEEACKVFDRLPECNLVSWDTIIAGFAQNGQWLEAIKCFGSMQDEGIKPDRVVFLSVLKACSSAASLNHGRHVHEEIIVRGHHSDVLVVNALIDMYVKCGSLQEAHRIFDKFSIRDVVSWNTMIAGYAQADEICLVLQSFNDMDLEGIKPDRITFFSALEACEKIEVLYQGRAIHERMISFGLQTDVLTGNSLIHMYAKCASLDEACNIFDKLHVPDVVSWNALIAAYAENDKPFLAIKCLNCMQQEGKSPNNITYLIILKAYAMIGSVERGRCIHEQIIKNVITGDHVQNALVSMYAKCGSMEEATRVFDNLDFKDIAAWSAMIAGHAQLGDATSAVFYFEAMQCSGTKPNELTFILILIVCSRAGLIEEGHKYFGSMRECHDIRPSEPHYNCMVDLYGRAGFFLEAEKLVQFTANAVGWRALLNACKMHDNRELASQCFDEIVGLNCSTYTHVKHLC